MNKSIVAVSSAVKAARSIGKLDRFDAAVLDQILDSVQCMDHNVFADPKRMVKAGIHPHKTRDGQHVLRNDSLVVSVTVRRSPKGVSVQVQHVKKLARVKPLPKSVADRG